MKRIPAKTPKGTDSAEAPSNAAIRIRNISKMYPLYSHPQARLMQSLWHAIPGFLRGNRRPEFYREFWALRDVTLQIKRGETVGIIGRNGSGKSTLLQIIAGTLTPTTGEGEVNGRVAALLELGSGFNPEFTGRENVYLNGAILGFSRAEMNNMFDEIAAFADIGEFIDQPIRLYSSGMFVRLAFAVQACVRPDILIVDEALAVGDIMFQARCLEKINELRQQGTTTLFVTHDLGTFQNLCNYGYLLDKGSVFSSGQPARVATQYYELMRESEHARQQLARTLPAEKERIRQELDAKEKEIRQKTNPGEYRFGTGTAQIVEYHVMNNRGQKTPALKIGEKFTVLARVEFYGRVENLALGIMFRNAQGQNLMGMHTFHEHRIKLGPFDIGQSIEIMCEQEMLLNPGDYLLHISIADCRTDYDFTSLDYRDSLQKISVFGKPFVYGLINTRPHFQWKDISKVETTRSLRPYYDISVLEYNFDQAKATWEGALDSPELQMIVEKILQYRNDNLYKPNLAEEIERALPSEPRFVQSGYYKMMLGRYAFAGSQFCRDATVLDTCCGLGWGDFLVSHYAHHVTAFDIDSDVVEICKSAWPAQNVDWLTGDVRDLSFLKGKQYDVVLGMESIEHFIKSDSISYIQQVANILHPGGVFVGTSPLAQNEQEAQELQNTNPYHLHVFTQQELLDLLKQYFSHAVIIGNWIFIAIR